MKINKVTILVKKATIEFDKMANPFFAEYDLSAAQFRIIKFLYAQPSKSTRIVDLEKQYSITHPTALGLVDQLEKKGYVKRIPNPNDKRGKLVSLTNKANSMKKELEKIGDNIEQQFTKNLTVQECEQLARLLNKLLGMEE